MQMNSDRVTNVDSQESMWSDEAIRLAKLDWYDTTYQGGIDSLITGVPGIMSAAAIYPFVVVGLSGVVSIVYMLFYGGIPATSEVLWFAYSLLFSVAACVFAAVFTTIAATVVSTLLTLAVSSVDWLLGNRLTARLRLMIFGGLSGFVPTSFPLCFDRAEATIVELLFVRLLISLAVWMGQFGALKAASSPAAWRDPSKSTPREFGLKKGWQFKIYQLLAITFFAAIVFAIERLGFPMGRLLLAYAIMQGIGICAENLYRKLRPPASSPIQEAHPSK